VILDACRDNPFKAKLAAAMGVRSVVVGRGLRPIEAPSATVIAYATRADDVAADGIGTNSPFTTALLKHLETPGLEVRFLFGRVSDDVRRATGGKQDPAIYASLGGTQYFLRAQTASPPVPSAAAADYDLEFWNSIKNSTNVADYGAYLEQYPNGRFAALARVRSSTARVPAEPTPSLPSTPPPLPQAKPTPPADRPVVASAASAAPKVDKAPLEVKLLPATSGTTTCFDPIKNATYSLSGAPNIKCPDHHKTVSRSSLDESKSTLCYDKIKHVTYLDSLGSDGKCLSGDSQVVYCYSPSTQTYNMRGGASCPASDVTLSEAEFKRRQQEAAHAPPMGTQGMNYCRATKSGKAYSQRNSCAFGDTAITQREYWQFPLIGLPRS
jgi:hypothetical protein